MVDFGLPLVDTVVLYPVLRGRDSQLWVFKLGNFYGLGPSREATQSL